MTAIEALTKELKRIEQVIAECTTESGYVKNEMKWLYNDMVKKAKSFKEAIDFMKSLQKVKV